MLSFSPRCLLLLGAILLLTTPAAGQSPPSQLDWAYLENDQLRVGVLRSHGGALGYLSHRNSDRNLLNHHDHGRLVQQSYYGDEDGSLWADKPWRYNPVQGGDYQGQATELLEFKLTEKTAYARTRPRNWAGGQLLPECEMEQWLELDGPLVRLKFAFTYRGQQTHAPRDQETPAMFVAPELSTLVSYTGAQPWTSAPLSTRRPGWPNESFKLAEHWVAWVDDQGQGIGLYAPQSHEATCYRYRGGEGSDCSYVAPLQHFALQPNLEFSYSVWLTVGDANSIRERFGRLRESQPPVGPAATPERKR